MKIAILSDIHGNDVAFEAVAQDMHEASINLVIFLGDLVAQGAQPQECYDRLKKMKPLVWLKGHTEYWLDDAMINLMPTSPENVKLLDAYDYMVKHMSCEAMDDLIGLKKSKEVNLGHYEGFCCHGSPKEVSQALDPVGDIRGTANEISNVQASFILSGHSHQQYDTMFRGIRMMNPGPVGGPYEEHHGLAKYAVLTVGDSFSVVLKEVPYDGERYREIAVSRGFPL